MLITNYNEKNPIKIKFDLSILEDNYLSNDDFCLHLHINISVGHNENFTETILIDRNSVEKLIACVKSFAESEREEFYYEPLEGDFWMYMPKPILGKKEILAELVSKGAPPEYIEALEMEYTHRLFFLVNTYGCGTGISYCLDVRKEALKQFAEELEERYLQVMGT